MRGAIIGDVCASVYEHDNLKTEKFYEIPLDRTDCRFTDDTVLTCAVTDACLDNGDYAAALRRWGRRYRNAGYGGRFIQWLKADDAGPYDSFGNGSAMRVSVIGWLYGTLEETLAEAERSAAVTHNHPEGVKGAQAVAAAIYWARIGRSKKSIRRQIVERFGYDLDRTVADIRKTYAFDVSCQGSVPEALIAFLEGQDFTHTLRLAISLGGDSDTIACIAGSVAEAYYGTVPEALWSFAEPHLTDDMRDLLARFDRRRRTSHGKGMKPIPPVEDQNPHDNEIVGTIQLSEAKTMCYPEGNGIGQPVSLHEYGSMPAAMARSGARPEETEYPDVFEAVRLEREGGRCLDAGEAREGLDFFLQAQERWRALAEKNPTLFTTDLATSLCNTSNLYDCLGDAERRDADWAELIPLVRAMIRNGAFLQFALAQALSYYGLKLKEAGRLEESLAAHEEALPLYRELCRNDARFNYALANGLNLLAVRLGDLGRHEQVLSPLEEAIQTTEDGARRDPDTLAVPFCGFLRNLSNFHVRRGETYKALAALRRTVDYARWLTREGPNQYTTLLGDNLYAYGSLLNDARAYTESLAAVTEAAELFQSRSDDLRNPVCAGWLAKALEGRGIVLETLERRAEALDAVREASLLLERLAEREPAEHIIPAFDTLLRLCTMALRYGDRDTANDAYRRAQALEQRCQTEFGDQYTPFVEDLFPPLFKDDVHDKATGETNG